MFIVIPILEFTLLIEIGRVLGTLPTLILILGTGVVGAYFARLEGLRILYSIRSEFAQGYMPTEKLLDGLIVLIAGVVLITPGLLTDIAGLMLLIPLTRYPIKYFLKRRAQSVILKNNFRISR